MTRGVCPDDDELFGAAALPRLRVAQGQLVRMLGWGYPMGMALRMAGDHHQLHARQRLALQRSTCSAAQRVDRGLRCLPVAQLAGLDLAVDGFNLIVTLEVALAGGLILAGSDGALRDLAGLRGNYRLLDETDVAIGLLGAAAGALGLGAMTFWLDAPVSNSGRLRARILERAADFPGPIAVELVPDADPVLGGRERVVSSDAAVLDACATWVNLAGWIVATRVPGARVVELCAAPAP